MVIAQAWGLVRFVLDFVYPAPLCGELDERPAMVKNFNAYYHTVTQLILAAIAIAVISCFTEKIPEEKVRK